MRDSVCLCGFESCCSIIRRKIIFLISIQLFLLAVPAFLSAQEKTIKIGVRAHLGFEKAIQQWSPTAQYLTRKVPPYRFEIVPLDLPQISVAVKNEEVDFLLVPPGISIDLEIAYGVSRLATLKNRFGNSAISSFGGVIFTRADNRKIFGLSDLKGKKFIAVDPEAFGGWWAAWRELKKGGINPFKDFAELQFSDGRHDATVYAVRDGQADAGTIRTDMLEGLAEEGKINIKDFRVIVPDWVRVEKDTFPFPRSTRLYPEWPFAKLPKTPDDLATKVAVALMSMQIDDPAAKAANYAGWSYPLNYEGIKDLEAELGVGYYKDYGKLNLRSFYKKYWANVMIGFSFVALIVIAFVIVAMKNRELSLTKRSLHEELVKRKEIEEAIRDSERRYIELSITDGLTGLYNLRHFYDSLYTEIERSRRYSRPLSVLLLDIDDFKHYNDDYGHLAGDRVLERMGETIKRCIRKTDMPFRYGGDEFVIIMPETTGDQAAMIGERIRTEFKAEHFYPLPGQGVYKTISLGVTQFYHNEDWKTFISRADRNMYEAKRIGKDRFFHLTQVK